MFSSLVASLRGDEASLMLPKVGFSINTVAKCAFTLACATANSVESIALVTFASLVYCRAVFDPKTPFGTAKCIIIMGAYAGFIHLISSKALLVSAIAFVSMLTAVGVEQLN